MVVSHLCNSDFNRFSLSCVIQFTEFGAACFADFSMLHESDLCLTKDLSQTYHCHCNDDVCLQLAWCNDVSWWVWWDVFFQHVWVVNALRIRLGEVSLNTNCFHTESCCFHLFPPTFTWPGKSLNILKLLCFHIVIRFSSGTHEVRFEGEALQFNRSSQPTSNSETEPGGISPEVCPHKRNFAADAHNRIRKISEAQKSMIEKGRVDYRKTNAEHSIKNPHMDSCNSGSFCQYANETEQAAVNQTLAFQWRGETWHSRSLVGAWTLHLWAHDFGVAMDASSGTWGYTRKGLLMRCIFKRTMNTWSHYQLQLNSVNRRKRIGTQLYNICIHIC